MVFLDNIKMFRFCGVEMKEVCTKVYICFCLSIWSFLQLFVVSL